MGVWGLSKIPALVGYAKPTDGALLVGHVGDITKSNRYIHAENI